MKHVNFKKKLVNSMIAYQPDKTLRTKPKKDLPADERVRISHAVTKLSEKGSRKQKPCFYCQHGRGKPKRVLTSYYCTECGIDKPLCPPTSSRNCFEIRISHGLPSKRRYSKKNN